MEHWNASAIPIPIPSVDLQTPGPYSMDREENKSICP